MESKISKAQLEVWDWKEKGWEEIKDLPKEEQLPYIVAQTRETVAMIEAEKRKRKLKEAS